jgi:hypothetical protein
VTTHGLDDSIQLSAGSTAFTRVLQPNQGTLRRVKAVMFPGVSTKGREATDSLTSIAEVKIGGAIPLLPPYAYMA